MQMLKSPLQSFALIDLAFSRTYCKFIHTGWVSSNLLTFC